VEILANPHRSVGLPALADAPLPSTDASAVARLLALCPAAAITPLADMPDLARQAGIADLRVKDERARMGLGSFKALGAAYAIAREADAARSGDDWGTVLAGRTYVCASAGNHGLSVAAGARIFGARAVILLPDGAPEAFAERLRAKAAEVRRPGGTYEDAMAAADGLAESEGWTLLSDSSWPGYTELPFRVMEGYLQMAAEVADALPEPPGHILLQAGVGGMAAAVAAHARATWGEAPRIVVVEPAAAPALLESIRAGAVVDTRGPVSSMGRLDCKTPSLIALAGLARDANLFVAITEDDAASAVARLAEAGLATTPSGAAGLAALFTGKTPPAELGLDDSSRVLAFLTEGPETP
jgi:diaminopropionate ammonia-lyase